MPISVSKELYEYINSQKREGENVDKCVMRLLKPYNVTNWEGTPNVKSLHLSSETVSFIKEFKITYGESVDNILTRLLLKK